MKSIGWAKIQPFRQKINIYNRSTEQQPMQLSFYLSTRRKTSERETFYDFGHIDNAY